MSTSARDPADREAQFRLLYVTTQLPAILSYALRRVRAREDAADIVALHAVRSACR